MLVCWPTSSPGQRSHNGVFVGGVQPQELFVAFLTIVYNKDAVASHKDITVVRKHVLASPSQTDVLFKSIDPSVFCLAITEMPFFTSSMRLWQMVRGNESDRVTMHLK